MKKRIVYTYLIWTPFTTFFTQTTWQGYCTEKDSISYYGHLFIKEWTFRASARSWTRLTVMSMFDQRRRLSCVCFGEVDWFWQIYSPQLSPRHRQTGHNVAEPFIVVQQISGSQIVAGGLSIWAAAAAADASVDDAAAQDGSCKWSIFVQGKLFDVPGLR